MEGNANGMEASMTAFQKWPANTLRAECRQLKIVPESQTKKGYLAALRGAMATGTVISADVAPCAQHKPRKQSEQRAVSSTFRLINVLFFQGFFNRFSNIIDSATRPEFDAPFWAGVAEAYNDHGQRQFNVLQHADACFTNVDPSAFEVHGAKQLWAMWMNVRSEYRAVYHQFRGTVFDDGRLDIYYLHLMETVTRPTLLQRAVQVVQPQAVAIVNSDSGPPSPSSTPAKNVGRKRKNLAKLAVRQDTSSTTTPHQVKFLDEEVALKRIKNEQHNEIHDAAVQVAKIQERSSRVEFMLSLQRHISVLRRQTKELKSDAASAGNAQEFEELQKCIAVLQKERDSCLS